MSTNLLQHLRLDQTLLIALPKLAKSLKLGAIEDFEVDEDVTDISMGSALDSLEQDAADLGATVAASRNLTPAQIKKMRTNYAAMQAQLRKAIATQPANVQAVMRPLQRVVQASSNAVTAAGTAALQLRMASTYKHLQRPNNQTTVHVLNLANAATTGAFKVTAPVSGRPFRFMGMSCEVSTVGTSTVPPTRGPIGAGFTSFNILGNERVKNDNITLSTGTLATATWDFTQFSKLNDNGEPEEKIYPWGIGASGWFESDFSFTFVVANNCGLAINAQIVFYWQASPCDDDTSGRGVYRQPGAIPVAANRSAKLFRNVLAYSPHPVMVSGYEDDGDL